MAEGDRPDPRSRPFSGAGDNGAPRRDRRAATRHRPVWPRAWLGWREPAGFQCVPCWIRDIGVGGIQLGLHEIPPVGVALVFRLDGEWLPTWFEVRILELIPEDQPGFVTARMAFPGSCPFKLFMAVAYGHLSGAGDPRQPLLPGFHASPAEPASGAKSSSPFDRLRTASGTNRR